MENTGYIQIGEVAMRDPLTRRHRPSIPLYAKETDCSMDATISDLAKIFAQLMKNDALERAEISARDRKSAKNGKSAKDAKNARDGKSAKDWEKLIGRRKARRTEKSAQDGEKREGGRKDVQRGQGF